MSKISKRLERQKEVQREKDKEIEEMYKIMVQSGNIAHLRSFNTAYL